MWDSWKLWWLHRTCGSAPCTTSTANLWYQCQVCVQYIEPVDPYPVLPVQLTSATSVRYVYIDPVDLYPVL